MLKRKKITETHCTLLELAYVRTGSFVRAAKVVAFVTAWGVVRRELDHEPTMDEYADWWKQSRATAFREQALFREVFPTLDHPGPVLDHLESAAADEPVRWGPLATA